MDLLIHFQTIVNGKGRAYLDPVMKPSPTRVAVRMPRTTKVKKEGIKPDICAILFQKTITPGKV